MGRSLKKADSVYDFLYVDAKRIGLFLSQFGTDGVITELTRETDTSSETSGGFDLKLAKMDQKEGEKTGLTRRFDPQWLVPLLFLRESDDLIVRDISKARIGQFVLVSGTLSVSDLSILRNLWDVPFVQSLAAQGMNNNTTEAAPSRQERRANRQSTSPQKQSKPALDQVKGLLDIIKILPHGTLATIGEDGGSLVWSTLRNDSLIISSSDLMLNHGATITGRWNMVGILDALPDTKEQAPEIPANLAASPVLDIIQKLSPITRFLLGRPPVAFGMTPLLIFREIVG